MAKIQNLESLQRKISARLRKATQDNVEGTVGFTAAYATKVHEDLEAYHSNGQAKFLEQPARTLQGELAAIIKEALLAGKTMREAVLLACLRLQREAQLLVPVDTGLLRNSAFSRVEQKG